MPFTMRAATLSLSLGASFSSALAAINPPITPNLTLSSNSSTPTVNSNQQILTYASPPPSGAKGALNPECVAQNLTADTWNRLQLDKYLAQYPGGKNLSLTEYADSKNAQNFRCGIGEDASVGQICDPVPALDWYVLVAAQEWNSCMNSVFKAVHYAVSTVQSTLAMMVTSLAERNLQPHQITFDVAALVALFAAVTAVLALGLIGLVAANSVFAALAAPALIFGYMSAAGSQVAPAAFVTSDLLRNQPSDKKKFIKWASVGNAFSQWEIHMQEMIFNTTRAVIESPISSPAGISSVVRNGTFLFETQPKSTSDLQIEYETVLQARSLTQVLRAMGGYVTRASNKCDGKGPNGARAGDKYLSYCGPDKIMMNVVLARGDKTVNKINNAKDVASKFGFTTEYITTQSWNCQQKYGKFEADPYLNAPLPSSPLADCVVNLPVCDLTDQKIDLARHHKHHYTTLACRNLGGLPI